MHLVKEPNAEPIPGYRLLAPLGRGGFGEVWKCTAPGGLVKAVKFVSAGSELLHEGPGGAEQEMRALQRIKSIRHPFLLSIDRIEVIAHELILITELADRSLHDLFGDYQKNGQPGIPRGELLAYLREAAEVLDLMNLEHGLQHLDIKPQNLFLVGRHIKVADFGLVNSLTELPGGTNQKIELGAITPLYASPECFLGRISQFSDQYSLAVTYHELLTGVLPFAAKNFRQLAHDHLQVIPDLARVHEADRPALARALAKEPRERFPSCTAFVDALEGRVQGSPALPAVLVTPDLPKKSTDAEIKIGEMAATAPVTADQLRQIAAAQAAAPSKVAEDSILPGYRFLDCLSRQPTGEIWRALDKSGRPRQIRFVYGFEAGQGPAEQTPLARLRRLKHDLLVPQEVVASESRLVLITDTPERTLLDELKECQRRGQSGIPRAELLEDLQALAGALDELQAEHGLQHLTLSPRSFLVLPGGKLRIADFGLAELVWLPGGHHAGALNTRYAAPELFEGLVSPTCDQYSLALIFQELLTGVHPFRNLNPRQMAVARQRGRPDVALLPATDRAIMLRALHNDPTQRFPNCTAFLEALTGTGPRRARSGQHSVVTGSLLPGRRGVVLPEPRSTPLPTPLAVLHRTLGELVRQAAEGSQICEFNNQRYLLWPGQRVEHRCFARLVPSTIKLKLDGFRQQWNGRAVSRDERCTVIHVPLPGSMMQRLLGRTPVLEVKVELVPCHNLSANMTSLLLTLCPQGSDRPAEVLSQVAVPLLDSLRNYLQASPERRRHERWPCDLPATAQSVDDETPPMSVRIRDISLGGVGVVLPVRPQIEEVVLTVDLPDTEVGQLIIPGQLIHPSTTQNGVVEAGVRFDHNDE
jgi:serine/threonine protein kinase